jgi:2-dehydropantoate 2-reductase
MRVLVYGAGGVGGYFAARLAEAGVDVTLVARGAHGEAVRRNGLDVRSVAGDVRLSVPVVETPAEAKAADVVILGVKAFQVQGAAKALAGLLSGEAFVLPLQNGVDAPRELAAVLGDAHVVPGLCRISSFVEAPGIIRHVAVDPSVELGERDGRASLRVEALASTLGKAKGVQATVRTDIEAALWEKFLFISPASGLTAATRQPIGVVRELRECRAVLEAALRESIAVAEAHGVRLPEDAAVRTFRLWDGLPGAAVPSMARDISLGKPSELEYQTGAVVRLGRERGVPTPVNDLLYACLLPSEREARKSPPA